ncbi:MAG TPA: phospho-sugar mutase, partial [Microbacterium sp.]|nr:phospho-sugar mutase [Microbacterium sp.]
MDAAADVLASAHAWLAQDPDGETRAELRALIEAAESGNPAALEDLEDRFSARLAFGTAGLRGALGAGSNRMNRVLVAQAAAGLAAYVREKAGLPPVGVEAASASDDMDADAATDTDAAPAAHGGTPDDGVVVAPAGSGDEPAHDVAADEAPADAEREGDEAPVDADADATTDAEAGHRDDEPHAGETA